MNNRKVRCACTICLLMLLFITPASAYDAMVDRSRTQFDNTSTDAINYINTNIALVKNDFTLNVPYITTILDNRYGADSDSDFLDDINSLDDTTDSTIVLIHTHGGNTTSSSSYLCFKDGSRLYDYEVSNQLDEIDNGGLLFAAACKGAKYPDLGYSFIYKGFDSFFGYKVTVNSYHNALFYSSFFDYATAAANRNVAHAADYAEDEVYDAYGNSDDVGEYRFLGSSYFCIRT